MMFITIFYSRPSSNELLLKKELKTMDVLNPTEEDLCLVKSCYTLYLTSNPAKTLCTWKLCDDVMVEATLAIGDINPVSGRKDLSNLDVGGMHGADSRREAALVDETQTDLSVRTKRWRYPDAVQHCIDKKCGDFKGAELYQCVYRKCLSVGVGPTQKF